MGHKIGISIGLLSLLLAGQPMAASIALTPKQESAFREDYCGDDSALSCRFKSQVKECSEKVLSVLQCAASLSAKFNLDGKTGERLAYAWAIFAAIDRSVDGTKNPQQVATLGQDAFAVAAGAVRDASFAREALQIASRFARDGVPGMPKSTGYGECGAKILGALVDGAPDRYRAIWHMLEEDPWICHVWHIEALRIVPDHPANLSAFAREGTGLPPAFRVAIAEKLLAKDAVALGLPAGKRPLGLHRRYIADLLHLGHVQAALATYAALPEKDRASLISNADLTERATLGAIEFAYEDVPTYGSRKSKAGDELSVGLALADILSNAPDRARKRLAAIRDGEKWETALRATFEQPKDEDIEEAAWQRSVALGWIVLQRSLRTNPGDLYDWIEASFGPYLKFSELTASYSWRQFLLSSKVLERYRPFLVKKSFQNDAFTPWRDDTSDNLAKNSELAAFWGDAFVARVDAVEAVPISFDVKMGFRRWKSNDEPRSYAAEGPGLRRFNATSIATAKGLVKAAKPDSSGMTGPLGGFSTVRMERDGDQAVAVTLSQALDPTGEVSAGGYWVHTSRDGGKTWGRPYYTGLSHRFPYEIAEQSSWRMIAGGKLRLEVEIKEIDPASVSLPPVGLKTRRRESGLMLDISLDDLTRDSDGDGLTDIEEEKLLLDPRNPDSDGDGQRDSRDPLPNVKAAKSDPRAEPVAAILGRLMELPSEAILMGVDKKEDDIGAAFGEGGGQTTALAPVMVKGDAADYAGLNPTRMMLIYSDAQAKKLSRTMPWFGPLRLDPLVLNQAGNRGFVAWSTGWTGGVFRVLKENARWRVQVLSQWVT